MLFVSYGYALLSLRYSGFLNMLEDCLIRAVDFEFGVPFKWLVFRRLSPVYYDRLVIVWGQAMSDVR